MSNALSPSTQARFVPRERLGEWRRWEAQSLHAPEPIASTVEDVETDTRQQEEAERLERLMREAREHGYKEGYAQGHAEGLAAGRSEGYAQGEAEGRKQGIAEGLKDAAAQVASLRQAVNSVAQNLAAFDSEVCNALTDLAMSIARQVVQTELQHQPENIIPLVRQVLRTAPVNGGLINVHLNPADAELATTHLDTEIEEERWRIVPDPSLERGGCRVVTSLGEVDATLQTRWRQIAEALNPGAQEQAS